MAMGAGGTAPSGYTFQWDANAANQTTANATGLRANINYCVTVTDGNNCSDVVCITLTQPAFPTSVATITSTDVTCNGATDGTVTAAGSGGTSPYNYLWGANASGATTSNVTGLTAGNYCVTVTDANGCTATACVDVNEPTAIGLSMVNVINIDCKGDSTGEATIQAIGGSGSYVYQWNDNADSSTIATVAGLAAGEYCVTVTDGSGCQDSLCVTLTEPVQGLEVNATVTSNFNGSQIQCFGDSTGTAMAMNTGGNGTITYLWSIGGVTTANIGGLPDGTFCVTATDATGCQDSSCVTLVDPTPVVATITSSTNVNCNGVCSGEATVGASGGTGVAYTFLWDANAGNQATATATGLCAGLYSVSVTDVNGCIGVTTVNIVEPTSAVQASALVTSVYNGFDVSCNTANDGEATAAGSGGTGIYTYQWNGAALGQTTATAVGLSANVRYCVTVTDALGCQDSTCVTLVAPSPITPVIDTVINVACFGDSTGCATASTTGGVGPYSYLWETGATDANICGLPAGSFLVTVTDANGCVSSAAAIVTEPAGGLDVDAVVTSSFAGGTQLQCFGDSSGSALATITDGTAPYNVQWTNGATTTAVNQLADGTYCIAVTDAAGCTDTACVTLTQPTVVVLNTVSVTNTSCNGGCDGQATVAASGGIAGYTYQWDANAGNQTTATATGLCANVYAVTVTDANGCITSGSVTVTEPATAVVATATVVQDISCAGGLDGIATASAIGGTVAGPYNYSWSVGGLTDTITGLAQGQVCVTITDDNGCSDVACVTITEPAALTSSMTNVIQINCNGDSTGSATVVPTGGTGTYTYAWSADAGSQSTATATGLPAGSFDVTITDANNCQTTNSVVITQPAGGLSALAAVTTPVQCAGDSSGAAAVTIVGGTVPYRVLWDQGSTTAAISGLPDGTYCVTVTDNNGCTDTSCVTLVDPTAVTLSLVSSVDASCRGDNNGEATVIATGGSSPYTYEWDANAANQPTANATGLGAGVYAVTATDNNLCQGTFSVTISEPATGVNASANIVSNYNGQDVSCNGSTDGMIEAIVTGGTGPYTYLWTDGTVNDTLMNVGAAQHCVTITDVNGCSDIACVTVTEPTVLTASIGTSSNASCNGTCDGTATATPTGGTAPYTYRWDAAAANQTTATIINLCAGSYNVTITDANGCEAVGIAVITQPTNRLDATVVVTSNYNGAQISCNGASDGEITASATGGTGVYRFNWLTNASTTNIATGLAVAGNTHCVVVSDANGCVDTACIDLVEPTAPTITVTNQVNVSCNGLSDGSATVAGAGGTGAFRYDWDPVTAGGQTTARANNLPAGSHCVTITDLNGCQISTCVNITEPTLLTATANIISNYNGEDVSCAGSSDGIVEVLPAGGTVGTGYTYTWSNSASVISDTNTVAAAGALTVTVTDANGCIATASVTLTEPNAVTATIASSVDASCNGTCDGQATVAGAGGTVTSGYTFTWSASANNQTTAIATGLCAGTHSVTVTDNNNCDNVTTVTINQPLTGITASATITSNYNGADVSCIDACDGEATAVGAGGTGAYTYLWDANAGSQNTAIATGLCGDSTYVVTVTDAGGCENYATVTPVAPTQVVATVTSNTTVTCGGGNDAEATVTGAGGTLVTANYTYAWNTVPVQNTATATGLSAGTYEVTVTDDNGCIGVDSVTIIEPAVTLFVSTQVTSNYNGQDISCNGECDGAGQVTITGGIPAYTILWSNGASTDSITNLCAGTYTVTVSDNGGCIIEDSVVITEPILLTATDTSLTNVSCLGGNDGAVTVVGAGGTPGYTYAIQAGVNQANNGTFTNLVAGTYTVTVTDLNFCSTTVGVTITEPNSLPSVTAAVTSNYGNQDVSCFGVCDGEATATPTGGTAPYSFSWASAGGQTTQTATGLCAGVYGVVITDAGGCTASATVTVTEPSQLTGSLTGSTNVVCAGDSTGTVSIQVNGGTAPYTYAAGNSSTTTNSTTATITGLSAGGFNTTVTDANGCTVLIPYVITQPTQLTVTASVTSSYTNGTVISCNGACDGAATAVGAGGQSFPPPGNTYQFLWSDAQGQTNFTATGLCAGTYTVEITDQNNCTDIDTVILVEPTPLGIVITGQVNVNCAGDSTGTATANITGGTPTYTYAWSNGQTNVTATGLAAGIYTVTATDGNNCTEVATVTITETNPIVTVMQVTSNYNGEPVSCFNSSDGEATVTATGGQAAYLYVWSDAAAQTTATATGLMAGTYFVTITDNLGCTKVDSITLTPPAAVDIVVTDTVNVNCFGQPTGEFTVQANGGVGPYLYSFNGGGTFTNTVTYTNLPANGAPGYQVIAQDDNGCQDTIFQIITEPAQLQSAVIAPTTQVSCFGGADGVITVTGVGGNQPYLYSFMGGSFDTTSTFTGLSAGAYNIEIRDSLGCTETIAGVVVTQPAELLLAVDTVINPLCTGDCNGAIHLSATQGTAGYEYSIDGINYQLSGIFGGLCDGGYTVFVRDAQGCIVSRQVVVTQPTALIANAAVTSFYPPSPAIQQFNVSCNGATDGSATATPFGGTSATGTYTYNWSFGGQPTQSITGLSANTTYLVTVTDDNGCTDVDSVILTEPTPLGGTFTQVTNETCPENNDGVISVTATSGTGVGPYTYDFGAGPSATINTMTGLEGDFAGRSYSVTITDANGCTEILDTLLYEPDTMKIATIAATTNYNGFEVSCFNATDGGAAITTSGGTPGYSYLWLPAGTTTSVSGLGAGTYGVTVTDANGCTDTASITLESPTQLSMTTALDSAGCNGTNTGGIAAIPNGSIAPYTYAIDSNGTVSPYGPDSTFANLNAGTYTIYVQDANGCGPVAQTVTIGQDAPITWTASVATPYNGQQVSCNGEEDATASVTATGGAIGGLFFTYQWDAAARNQTGSVATGLGAGTYTVLITDTVSFCTETATVTIVEPAAVALGVDTIINVGCANQGTGAIQVSATGGTPAYSYDISAGGQVPNTTGIFTGLTAGTYDAYVIDINGCTDTIPFTIQNADSIEIDLDTINVSCYGNSDGIVTATVTGGQPGYTLTWNPLPAGNTNGLDSIGQLPAGNYTLTVQDAAGCTASATATVVEPDSILVSIIDSNATCANSDGVIIISATGGPSEVAGNLGNYTYSIDGGSTFSATDTFRNLPSGFYQVVVRDAALTGCTGQNNVDLGTNSDVVTEVSTTNESCFGVADGTAMVTATSAAGGFTYEWTQIPGATLIIGTTQTISGLSGNVSDPDRDGDLDTNFYYIVTVTDAAGCTGIDTAYLLQPDSLEVNAQLIQDVSCYGGMDAMAFATVNGRDSNSVTYAWSNGATTDTVMNLMVMPVTADSSDYIVVITDSVGCTASDTITIRQPEALFAEMSGTTVNCVDSLTGIINIDSISGGTGTYEYGFEFDGPFGSIDILSQGLGAGSYNVYVRDANGCLDSVENVIIRDTIDYIVTAYMDQTIDLGETVTLYGAINSANIDSSLVSWSSLDPSTGIQTQLFQGTTALEEFTPDTFYNDMIFILSLNNGCGDSATVEITVNKVRSVYVPNAFSPNGDGNNDIFTVYGAADVDQVNKLMIFDRWGEMVHEAENFPPSSIDPDHGWDGTFRGQPMNSGVFIYYTEIQLKDGTTVIRKGDLTLIR
jgi:gliding motility-associated-like protein